MLLPAAAWSEKTGTFINSERRIGVSRQVRRAPGVALSDFRIFQLIAHYWGCGEMFSKWTAPQVIFDSMKDCSHGQPCDITGIEGYEMLEACGGVQWPAKQGEDVTSWGGKPGRERRLFEDGGFHTPDARARFVHEDIVAPPERPDHAYAFVLLTGRGTSAQWHTETRTGKSAMLRRLAPDRLMVDLHPDDARELKIADHAPVGIISRRAEILATARVVGAVRRGEIFLPMHHSSVNRLINPVFDPISRQPGYKQCAVRVRPVHHDG